MRYQGCGSAGASPSPHRRNANKPRILSRTRRSSILPGHSGTISVEVSWVACLHPPKAEVGMFDRPHAYLRLWGTGLKPVPHACHPSDTEGCFFGGHPDGQEQRAGSKKAGGQQGKTSKRQNVKTSKRRNVETSKRRNKTENRSGSLLLFRLFDFSTF